MPRIFKGVFLLFLQLRDPARPAAQVPGSHPPDIPVRDAVSPTVHPGGVGRTQDPRRPRVCGGKPQLWRRTVGHFLTLAGTFFSTVVANGLPRGVLFRGPRLQPCEIVEFYCAVSEKIKGKVSSNYIITKMSSYLNSYKKKIKRFAKTVQ